MTFWDDVRDPLWLPTHLSDCLYHVSFRRYRPLKLPLSCEVVEKGVFLLQICRGRVYPRFRTRIFKSQSLPSMWPVLVEFRSASSEGSWRKKKKIESFAVKPKFADKYVARPKKAPTHKRNTYTWKSTQLNHCKQLFTLKRNILSQLTIITISLLNSSQSQAVV